MNDHLSLSFIIYDKKEGRARFSSCKIRFCRYYICSTREISILLLSYAVIALEIYSFLQILFSVPQIFKEYLVTSLKGEVCSGSYSPALLLTGRSKPSHIFTDSADSAGPVSKTKNSTNQYPLQDPSGDDCS